MEPYIGLFKPTIVAIKKIATMMSLILPHNMRANTQIFMDNETLASHYPGKFVGVERLVRAA